MEHKRKMTKALIGYGLKSLMLRYPFEKITIKMITNEAGVIRPTFYNYFCDKYEVLEWIFSEEIIDKVRSMFEQHMYQEGIKLLFVSMKTDSQFYKKAFDVTGQNAFESVIKDQLYNLIHDEFKKNFAGPQTDSPLLTKETIAMYYSSAAVDLLKTWITGDLGDYDADQMVETYIYLIEHRLSDYIE